MYGRYKIVQVVEGHLFDEEWYERTDAFEPAADAPSGFYAVLWPVEEAPCSSSTAGLLGPFPDARLARLQARNILAGDDAAKRVAALPATRLASSEVVRGVRL